MRLCRRLMHSLTDPRRSTLRCTSGAFPHLDAESWRFYLPHLLRYALDNIANPASNAIDSILHSLRPPDRDPPRFGALTRAQQAAVVAALDQLAFSEHSVWKEPAMIALEEYWAPGATYR